jgi:hypothetical protein
VSDLANKKQENPQPDNNQGAPQRKVDAGQAALQAAADEAAEKGYYGETPDPTPNENYTFAGVTAGAPTPETDVELEKQGREASGIGMGPLEAAEKAKEENE